MPRPGMPSRPASRLKCMGKRSNYMIPALTSRQRLELAVLVACWAAGTIFYWWWWLNPAHAIGIWQLIINSVIFFYVTGLPSYSFFFALRMMRINSAIEIQSSTRVAMVVTKAPSEPWSMVKNTLRKMLEQDYQHDTWLADEEPTREVEEWCKKNRVFLSSRKENYNYQRDEWPRRKGCKEGNLAYFYDHHGYKDYDIVVQLDADHYPEEGYLEAMIRPFNNPKVGYVAAPSICDRNLSDSWTARGRLYFEAFLHGPLQMGYMNQWKPICIGSHYAVRTKALQEIGGLGPELAEDLSTSLLFISHGWEGAFADQAICHGLGPATFEDCMIQEFQWSKSITKILLQHSREWISDLGWQLKIQLIFIQWFYPIRGFLCIAALLFSSIALLTAHPWISIYYPRFIALNGMQVLLAMLPCIWLRQKGFMRPINTKFMAWETWLFEITRGPWVLLGVLSATTDYFIKKQSIFRVTQKEGSTKILKSLFLSPYLFMTLISTALAICVPTAREAQGYYLLLLLSATGFAIAAIAVVVLSKLETNIPWRRLKRPVSITLLTTVIVIAGWLNRQHEVMATISPENGHEQWR